MQGDSQEKHPYLRRRRQSVIRDFFRATSIHGLPAIARSHSSRHLAFWSLAFLLFFGIMLYFVVVSILAFFAYPTQTNVDIVVEYPMSFPAVTVCHYAGLRSDLFLGPFINYTIDLGLVSSNTSTEDVLKNPVLSFTIFQFLLDLVSRNRSIADHAFDLKELLFSCTYNDLPCNASDFVPVSFAFSCASFSPLSF